jgi:tetratricopeptide (TPR) repeat protein
MHAWTKEATDAHTKGELEKALRLWSDGRRAHPTVAAGYLEASKALRKATRLDEAEAVVNEALQSRCPAQFQIRVEHARVAEARGDKEVALRRWQVVAGTFPNEAVGTAGIVRSLLKLDRADDAERAIEAAGSQLENDAELARLAAKVAAARQDWPNALRRWELALSRYSDDRVAWRGRGAALWQIAMAHSEDGTTPPHGIVDVGHVDDPEAYELLMNFESLGDNCEFGLLQRRFGAEPLGLLRWTSVRPLVLLQLLETQFEGLAEPENVILLRTPAGEHWVKDTAFDLNFHTFQTNNIDDTEKFLAKQLARLRWLRDKMLADLKDGTKMFVYKSDTPLPEPLLERIARALHGYGGARLFYVEQAQAGAPAGTVVPCAGGALRGALSAVSQAGTEIWDIEFAEWLKICDLARMTAS